ncbi:MAG: carboxypeptidase regulatory-like domain-containing protein, partial [Myxococcales bacterium]|nr:carboxypeptidase regulatory-like domain-containing protein [Myxococcales bacterium]
SDTGGGGGDGGQGGATPQEGSVTVTVVGDPDATPLEGVLVIASNEDGTLADEAITDANGAATVAQPAGGSVSVLRTVQAGVLLDGQMLTHPQHETRTFYLALTGFDLALEVHVDRDAEPLPVFGPMNLSFDVQAVAGAAEYELRLSCGYREIVNEGQNTLDGFTCGGQPFDALLIARDADDVVLDYAFQTGVDYQAGADLALTLPFGQPLSSLTLDADVVTGVKIGAASYGVGPAGLFGPIFLSTDEDTTPTAPFTLTVPQVGSFATRWCALGVITLPNDVLVNRAACGSAPIADVAIDENEIGTIGGTLNGSEVTYSVDDNGPMGHGVEIDAFGLNDADETTRWLAFRLPDESGAFRFPELPASATGFAPADIDYVELDHIRFADGVGGDFIGRVASTPSSSLMNIGSGFVASTVYIGL